MEIKNVLDYLNLSFLILSVRERGPKVNKNYSVHVAWVDHGMEGGGGEEMCSWDSQTYTLDSCEILWWVGCTYIQPFSPYVHKN